MANLLLLSCLIIISLVLACRRVTANPEARAFFVFGDSLVDNGNNNFLATSARADSPPYGIDSPSHRPTGRFSNGLNFADVISENLGSEPPLPYLSPELKDEKLLVGANFASAGVGILNDTGAQFVNIIRMYKQLQLFEHYQERLAIHFGSEEAERIVNQAMVLSCVGENDFVNNYYLIPYSPRSRQFSINDYVQYLVAEYRKILRRLYDLGARRVLVTGAGPMGCPPAEVAIRGRNGQCDVELQRASALYNPQLVQMINGLNQELGSNIFVSVNALDMNMDLINNPQAYGFVTAKIACCGQGPYNGLGMCTPVSNLCNDRNQYFFWDNFHPTERANRLLVQQMMIGSTKYMHPMNLSTIIALDSRA
ncbi:hypothetical protein SLE2022_130980 [Rubroshorea leprosula]